MEDEADAVVESLGRRERSMAALMREYPQTSQHSALPEGVQVPTNHPRDKPECGARSGDREAGSGHTEKGRRHRAIAGDEAHAMDGRALEAVLRDAGLDLTL